MTRDDFQALREGDIVRHVFGEKALIVTRNLGDRVVAVYTADLTNPEEWLLVQKAAPITSAQIEPVKGPG